MLWLAQNDIRDTLRIDLELYRIIDDWSIIRLFKNCFLKDKRSEGGWEKDEVEKADTGD
jgi:hypothetical protein